MRSNSEKAIRWLFYDRIPLTKMIVLANVLTFIGIYVFSLDQIAVFGGFTPSAAKLLPWTFLTYPLVGLYCCGANGVISLLFAGFWMWMAGGSLERSWGTRTFGIFFFVMTAVTALGYYAGSILDSVNIPLANLWLPLAGVTIAFAMLNPEQQILFYFIIPLKLKYLALLDVALVIISYARASLILAILALAGCAFSYWYVRTGKQYGLERGPRRRAEVVRVHDRPGLLTRLSPFGWIRRSRQRRKLKKLFEDSGLDNPDRR